LTEEDKTTGKSSRILRPHLQIGPVQEALFREYPKARKPFISSADLGKFVDEKSRQEIHTLDDFAAFHREFRRLANRLAKEKGQC